MIFELERRIKRKRDRKIVDYGITARFLFCNASNESENSAQLAEMFACRKNKTKLLFFE